MQKVILFLNGEKPKSIPDFKTYEKIFCTDGAYHFLQELNIEPSLVIGDFDSIRAIPQNIATKHTPDQNYTDFEKALQIIIQKGHKIIDIYAAGGMEHDHFLGNICVALKYHKKTSICFYDDHQKYFFIDKSFYSMIKTGKMVSLFPFPKAKKVDSKGLKFPLKRLDLNMKKNKIGIRNEAIESEFSISFKKGNLLLFIEL